MEISNDSPIEYQSFALRRLFWLNFGLRYDEMTYGEVTEALLFMTLEQKHPHRQKKAEANGS